MPDKAFEHTITFEQFTTTSGDTVALPLIEVYLVRANGSRVRLSLLFDTGASVTTLRRELYPLFDAPSWDSGTPQRVGTAGGAAPVTAYRYQARLEVLGRTVHCPVHLQELPPNAAYAGLLGREAVFEHFGFGFWESASELYATLNP